MSRKVLPDSSILIEQKLLENAKNQTFKVCNLWSNGVTRHVIFLKGQKSVENAKMAKIQNETF